MGELVQFDGAVATQCELLNGPCVDLNLMVSKAMGAVPVRVERLDAPLPVAASCHDSTLVFCIDGAVVLDGDAEETVTLEPWDLAVLSHLPGQACRLDSLDTSTPALAFLATLSR